jgi:hypothetical protein
MAGAWPGLQHGLNNDGSDATDVEQLRGNGRATGDVPSG